jgi:hypothetical protein
VPRSPPAAPQPQRRSAPRPQLDPSGARPPTAVPLCLHNVCARRGWQKRRSAQARGRGAFCSLYLLFIEYMLEWLQSPTSTLLCLPGRPTR